MEVKITANLVKLLLTHKEAKQLLEEIDLAVGLPLNSANASLLQKIGVLLDEYFNDGAEE
jgi:hypothetical protein